jgi:tRNA dimethylallyltransferase
MAGGDSIDKESALHPVVAIVGPTASGKSDLAVFVAESFRGEVVNYDSVQVFRHFDIGSAKPTLEERRRLPHHMIDMREPDELFTAGDYQLEGRLVLEGIRSRGKLPVLVGGTGLYLRALTEGLFRGPSRSSYWRDRLEAIAEHKGREHLHRLLARLDAPAALRIAPRDKPKVIRALEVRLETGRPLSKHLEVEGRRPLAGFDVHMIGLNPPRDASYKRIDSRVNRMFDLGLVEEVRQLIARGVPGDAKPFGAIGYRDVLANLDACNSWDNVIRTIQRDTRHYAKRQMTWFRKQSTVTWFDGFGDDESIKDEVHRYVQTLLPREW